MLTPRSLSHEVKRWAHFLFCLQEHAPKLNSGTVIKSNDNQRYATNDATGFVVRDLAEI